MSVLAILVTTSEAGTRLPLKRRCECCTKKSARSSRNCEPELFDHCRYIMHDKSGLYAHYAIARTDKRAIPALVGAYRASLIPTVDFDDES